MNTLGSVPSGVLQGDFERLLHQADFVHRAFLCPGEESDLPERCLDPTVRAGRQAFAPFNAPDNRINLGSAQHSGLNCFTIDPRL
jgi:hypothetical protein